MKHYTIRAFQYTKPFESKTLALMCCNHLMRAHEDKRIFIDAFCLMPDHLHLCLSGTEKEGKDFIAKWKSFVTHESWKINWVGKLWQDGSFAKEAFSTKAESAIIEYVLRNPEAAGLVSMWKEWPFWAEPRFGKRGWNDYGEAVSGLAPKL